MNAENQRNFFEKWGSERDFIDAYENEYFEGSSSVKNTTERSFEDEIEGLLIKKEKYTPEDFAYAIGWKMGYSSKEKINEAFEKNKWKSGHGNPIKNLNKYIDFLESKQSDIKKPLTKYSRENVKEAYELLIDKKVSKKTSKEFWLGVFNQHTVFSFQRRNPYLR